MSDEEKKPEEKAERNGFANGNAEPRREDEAGGIVAHLARLKEEGQE